MHTCLCPLTGLLAHSDSGTYKMLARRLLKTHTSLFRAAAVRCFAAQSFPVPVGMKRLQLLDLPLHTSTETIVQLCEDYDIEASLPFFERLFFNRCFWMIDVPMDMELQESYVCGLKHVRARVSETLNCLPAEVQLALN